MRVISKLVHNIIHVHVRKEEIHVHKNSLCFSFTKAVRLGRCPKKDKPKKMDFFKLPQNKHGKVDIDKQIRSEQMVLTIHDAFRTALKDCTTAKSASFKVGAHLPYLFHVTRSKECQRIDYVDEF